MIRSILNALAGFVIALSGLYLVISLCILYFKLTGRLTDGPMYFDIQTPAYGPLLLFQGISIAIIAACFLARAKFVRNTRKT